MNEFQNVLQNQPQQILLRMQTFLEFGPRRLKLENELFEFRVYGVGKYAGHC